MRMQPFHPLPDVLGSYTAVLMFVAIVVVMMLIRIADYILRITSVFEAKRTWYRNINV